MRKRRSKDIVIYLVIVRVYLRRDWAESQLFMLNGDGNGRGLATFDQIIDAFTDSLGVAKKLDTELIVLVPAHD